MPNNKSEMRLTHKNIGQKVGLSSWGSDYVFVLEVLTASEYKVECLFHDGGFGFNADEDFAYFLAERPDGGIEIWANDDDWNILPPYQLEFDIDS